MVSTWMQFLIRRTNASRVQSKSSTTVGAFLPRVHSTTINCHYTEDENTEYKAKEKELLRILVNKATKTYSFSTRCKLGLLTAWNQPTKIDEDIDLKTGNIKEFASKSAFAYFCA